MKVGILQNVGVSKQKCISHLDAASIHQFQSPVTLTVPAPPSANKLFKSIDGGRRAKSKDYKDWLLHAGWQLRAQRPGHISGRVMLLIAVERLSHTADIDNRVKALLDLLVKNQVIDDDHKVAGFAVSWIKPKVKDGASWAHVLVLPAADMDAAFRIEPGGAEGRWHMISNPQPETGDA